MGKSVCGDLRAHRGWRAVVRARVVGNGPDTVVVPLAMMFARDLLPLASGRTLVLYDPRARGASDAVPDAGRLGMDFEVADLEAIRAHFDLQRFSLIGWSYMGAVVILYAAQYPEHVEKIVQIGPMAPRTESATATGPRATRPDPADLQYLAELRESGYPDVDPVGYCRKWYSRDFALRRTGRPATLAAMQADPCIYWNEWPDQINRWFRHVVPQAIPVRWDYSAQAARVLAAVLTIHGTEDLIPVEGGRDWVALLPEARIHEIPQVGHFPWLEASEEFFRVVDGFLKGN